MSNFINDFKKKALLLDLKKSKYTIEDLYVFSCNEYSEKVFFKMKFGDYFVFIGKVIFDNDLATPLESIIEAIEEFGRSLSCARRDKSYCISFIRKQLINRLTYEGREHFEVSKDFIVNFAVSIHNMYPKADIFLGKLEEIDLQPLIESRLPDND